MRAVQFKLVSTDENKTSDFTLDYESLRGDTWTRERSVALTSGMDEAEGQVLLGDNERLVISARGANTELVFDKDQNAAMPLHAFESQPTQAEKEEMLRSHQAELKGTAKQEAVQTRVADQAAARARDKAIADQQAKAQEAKDQEAKPPLPPQGSKPPQTPSPNPNPPQVTNVAKPTTTPSSGSGAGPAKSGMTAPGPSTGGQSSKDVK